MLYAERWDKVKASADSVFNLQMYSLTDAYGDAWKGGNSEAILEYEYLRTDRLMDSTNHMHLLEKLKMAEAAELRHRKWWSRMRKRMVLR